MEIKGENFIKNVQLKQEKEELQSKIDEIDNNIEAPTVSTFKYDQDIEQAEHELDDIMLGAKETPPTTNENNKKKYIVLGLALVVLFLITIVIFRVFTSKSNDDESSFVEKEKIKQEKALNDDNIEQQYQKIINQKLKNIKDQETEIEKKSSSEALDLKAIEKEEKKITLPKPSPNEIKKAKELKEDIFDIKNSKKVVQPKKTQPKVEALKVSPKKEIDKILAPTKKTVQERVTKVKPQVTQPVSVAKKSTSKVTTTTKPKGTFVQIGAFSKPINQKYLDNISAKGLEYQLYKVKIKEKQYTKVLIGPYRNKSHAQTQMPLVKQKLKIDSAFILSF